jgi:hypothetical protein
LFSLSGITMQAEVRQDLPGGQIILDIFSDYLITC